MSDEDRTAYILALRDAKRAAYDMTAVATLHLIDRRGELRRYQEMAKEAAEAAFRVVAALERVI